MDPYIKDRVIAITGASSGIGRSIARVLAAQGARVVLGARSEEKLRALTQEIREAGSQCVYVVTDVSRRADLDRLVVHATETYGRLDVMVNNAGIAPLGRIDELDVNGWDAMIDVNLKGVLYGMAAALPEFRKIGGGHIVNIVSTAGIQISPGQGVYAATKNAVRTLSEAFRKESDGKTRITAISPGFVRTGIADNMDNAEQRQLVKETMDQIAISPEAVAHAVRYALSQPPEVEIGELVIRPAVQR